MKGKAKKRLSLLLGAVLLSMLVVATTVQVASAMRVTGGAGSTESSTAASQPAALGQASSAQHNRLEALDANGAGATESSGSSGISSTTLLIIVAVVAGIVLIGVWAFARRRRGLTAASELTTSEASTSEVDSNAFCSLHPQDAECGAV